MITVAPVHCKYGRFLPISCFYSLVRDTLIWDEVCLSSSVIMVSSNSRTRFYCACFNGQGICTCAESGLCHYLTGKRIPSFAVLKAMLRFR